MSGIQLREVFGFGYTVGIQREEDACFLFSQVQSFKNGIAYPFRSECADMESEGNYRFKVVNLHMEVYNLEAIVALAFHIGTFGAERVRNAVLERLYLRKEKTSIFFSLNTNGISKSEYFS